MRADARDDTIRTRILREADGLFFTSGFSSVSMDDLAQRLGMSKRTIYQLFPSKEELLRAVMLDLTRDAECRVNAVLEDRKLGFVDKLHRLFAIISANVMRLRQPVLDDIRRSAMSVWEEFDEWRRRHILPKFERLIEQGIAEGDIKAELNPQLLTRMYATLVRQVVSPETLTELPLSATDAFRTLVTVFFEGILTPKARRRYRPPTAPESKQIG
jgi:AcrR family transcriptional regulator